jgi:1,4-alpha-glucan branching enzyme
VTGSGYANLVYHTYQTVAVTAGSGHWQRFFHGTSLNLIQCAEQLQKPVLAVEQTYTNCTWQNATLDAATRVASGDRGALTAFGLHLGLSGYPLVASHNGQTLEKSAFQYLENHDHPRFICRFGTVNLYREVLREGQRDHWFKVQPYLIGLLLVKVIPLMWQGQEIVEKYDVPTEGPARIGTLRPVRWELFYDEAGRGMIRLVRKLLALRNTEPVFRRGAFYLHNDWERWQSRGLLLFSRWIDTTYALVALNFTDAEHTTAFWFPIAGDYTEQLAGRTNLRAVPAGHAVTLTIPAHYGGCWLHA